MHHSKESMLPTAHMQAHPASAGDLREWAEISGISIGSRDGGPYPTLEQLAQFVELATSGRNPEVRIPSDEEIRQQIYLAVLSCPHEIEKTKIVLEFEPNQPGNNALNQLGLRATAVVKRLTSPQTAALEDVGQEHVSYERPRG